MQAYHARVQERVPDWRARISNATAVRDYKAEVKQSEGQTKAQERAENEREVDLVDDEELELLQKQRLKEMKAEAQRLQEASKAGHGQYHEVPEDYFLKEVTTS